MTPEDIARIDAAYQAALGGTDLACTGSLTEIQQHQTLLEEAMGGVENAITYFDKIQKDYASLRDEQKDKKKKLERAFERCKRTYWDLKDAAKRNCAT